MAPVAQTGRIVYPSHNRDGKECQRGGSLCLLEKRECSLSFAKRTGRSRPALSCALCRYLIIFDGWWLKSVLTLTCGS